MDWQRIGEVEVYYVNPSTRIGVVAFPASWTGSEVERFMAVWRSTESTWQWNPIISRQHKQGAPIGNKTDVPKGIPDLRGDIRVLANNWRNLAAGRQLDNYIARLLGWGQLWDGSAYDYAIHPDYPHGEALLMPNWSTKLEDAVKLPIESGYTWIIRYNGYHWLANTTSLLAFTPLVSAATAALAVCASWLEQQQYKKKAI